MQFSSVSSNRRLDLDRRTAEGSAPFGVAERRMLAERRKIEVEEFDFDESIVLGPPHTKRKK